MLAAVFSQLDGAQCVLSQKKISGQWWWVAGHFYAKYDGSIGISSVSRTMFVFPIEILFRQLISFMTFRFNASSPTQQNWACGIQHGLIRLPILQSTEPKDSYNRCGRAPYSSRSASHQLTTLSPCADRTNHNLISHNSDSTAFLYSYLI